MSGFSRMEEALEALANGRMIIVADAEERENEGDLIAAAEKVTAETVHFMITEGRGQLCMPLRPEIARRLQLRPMVPNKSLAMPCFTIPVDHRFCRTGISPKERAFTIQMIVDAATRPEDFAAAGTCVGHEPVARPDGRRRAGEAAGAFPAWAGRLRAARSARAFLALACPSTVRPGCGFWSRAGRTVAATSASRFAVARSRGRRAVACSAGSSASAASSASA